MYERAGAGVFNGVRNCGHMYTRISIFGWLSPIIKGSIQVHGMKGSISRLLVFLKHVIVIFNHHFSHCSALAFFALFAPGFSVDGEVRSIG